MPRDGLYGHMALDPTPKVVNILEVADRRRPGRPDHVSPELTELLRGTVAAGSVAPEDTDVLAREDDDTDVFAEEETGMHPLSGGRSIVMGLLFAVPLWALIGSVVWILF